MGKTGVLLINLGSPDGPDTASVRRYLREFLFDPRVIDIPPVQRWLLVYGVISIFRSPNSAHAYQKIWTTKGSPLVEAGRDLARRVQDILGDAYLVRIAMRYGKPSIASEVKAMLDAGVEKIHAFPLYPQYAGASTASSVEELWRVLSKEIAFPEVKIIGDFYDHPGFIASFAEVAKKHLADFHADHVLFSYHGLPEHQMQSADRSGQHCLKAPDCCQTITSVNRLCYRAQCFATTFALQKALGRTMEDSSLSFQSRLGRATWIQPYTDQELPILIKRGVKRLAVMCPAFVADCLETLEEIQIRAAEDWKALGGEALTLVPSLNSEEIWCRSVADMVK
ncbi:MAG: ferrochelatase [Chitinophagaceae bacterium]|nr:ferrochelatase [Oligoflexus sp.]